MGKISFNYFDDAINQISISSKKIKQKIETRIDKNILNDLTNLSQRRHNS